jgi:2-oxo-4-hydroxy-4-carboxy--5-ureidoimidazoline (OHCU) decarboxylase
VKTFTGAGARLKNTDAQEVQAALEQLRKLPYYGWKE